MEGIIKLEVIWQLGKNCIRKESSIDTNFNEWKFDEKDIYIVSKVSSQCFITTYFLMNKKERHGGVHTVEEFGSPHFNVDLLTYRKVAEQIPYYYTIKISQHPFHFISIKYVKHKFSHKNIWQTQLRKSTQRSWHISFKSAKVVKDRNFPSMRRNDMASEHSSQICWILDLKKCN